jgi:8-oxo-dGTP pyrophosphatase MutT (NUDIX family)
MTVRHWKRLGSSTVVDDPWMRLTADRCELPGGRVIESYWVSHEKEWVHVFALDAAGCLVVVRQYRHAAGVVCMELPGGVVDDGEEPLAAAQRELQEETGYAADDWVYLGSLFANPARQTNRVHMFVAQSARPVSAQRLDATEDIMVDVLPLDRVHAAIQGGEFSQALHVASFYRALVHLGLALHR